MELEQLNELINQKLELEKERRNAYDKIQDINSKINEAKFEVFKKFENRYFRSDYADTDRHLFDVMEIKTVTLRTVSYNVYTISKSFVSLEEDESEDLSDFHIIPSEDNKPQFKMYSDGDTLKEIPKEEFFKVLDLFRLHERLEESINRSKEAAIMKFITENNV